MKLILLSKLIEEITYFIVASPSTFLISLIYQDPVLYSKIKWINK